MNEESVNFACEVSVPGRLMGTRKDLSGSTTFR